MNKYKGFSIIELMVVVAIVGIITSMAMPTFMKMIERNKLKTVILALQNDIQHARTLAIKQNRNILIQWQKTPPATGGKWCYGLSANASCNCDPDDNNDSSDSTCEIKTVSGSAFNTVSMFTASRNKIFDFKRGTIAADGITLYTTNYAARITFSDVGRVNTCIPTTVSNSVAATNRPVGTIGLPATPDC